jgi:hypothetical protein
MAERPDYDALVEDINLKDITSCRHNANILRVLRDCDRWDPDSWIRTLYIMDIDEQAERSVSFVIDEGDDLGWLGYFIGKYDVLEDLTIWSLPWDVDGERVEIDRINSFFEGMSQNRSIKSFNVSEDIGFDGWSILGSFFENNRNLSHFEVRAHTIGNTSAHNIALALGQMNQNFLTDLRICNNEISDEGMAEIAAALGSQSQLERLFLCENNNVGRNSCVALGNTLSGWPASNELGTLYIDTNAIDDEGLQALAEGLMNCRSLDTIYLNDNPLITAAGMRSLSPLLQSEAHSLDVLRVTRINWGDDGAIALAEGLRGNKTLRELRFRPSTAGMTSVGWSAFSRLLCDTSTVNRTNLSNHTLTRVGCCHQSGYEETPEDIQNYLRVNNRLGRKDAAIYKILRSHPDLDMEPFFKLKLQFLPAVMSWFDRVEPIEEELIEDEKIEYSERSCQSRKLSALYKFVRAMPDLTIIGYWEGRMIHIEAETRRIADERRRLNDEERRLEYEKKVTLERLGEQPMDEAEVNRNKRMRHK